MQSAGKYLIVFGVVIIIIGLLFWLFGNKLNWLGNLPGDIKIEKENFKLYFPLTTMILFSAILSFILWVIRRVG